MTQDKLSPKYSGRFIMAIRNFELEDDIRFKNWISERGDDVKIIELKNFNADQIKRYINDFEDYEQLNDDQKSILTIPLWLGIYIDLSVNL